MKYRYYIILLILGLITSFFVWCYIQRTNFEYNAEGKFLSPEEGVVYHEQAKEVYGILGLFGIILIGIVVYRLIKK